MAESTPPSVVLVVDDNEANRALAQSTLEDEGYRVVLASDGASAIAAFEHERPDCVLLDVRMAGMDGFEVCERIRALPEGSDTPVIFLTAQRDVDTFDHAQRSGGDDFLTKPVRPAELIVRVQAALKLRRLGTELRTHYETLRHQRDDLLRLQLQKERLTAFVVHDLKNPVNTMDLHAQLLLRDPKLSDSARSSAMQIRSEARQLTRMIVNLLDLAKADENQLAPSRTKVDIRALVAEVFAELEADAAARQVRLRHEIGVAYIFADGDLVRRMLANLLENAARHAPKGSEVVLSVGVDGDFVELRVTDRGPGVPPDMREKVFDPYVRISTTGSQPPSRTSRGLGLTFCRVVAQTHGGRIWVEDAAPGSVFCVRFPNAE